MYEDNCPTQLGSEPDRKADLLDLLLTNREGLVGDAVVEAILSTATMTQQFSILSGVSLYPRLTECRLCPLHV